MSLALTVSRRPYEPGNPIALGVGTGFVVIHRGENYLITNGHVLNGRNPDTGEFVGERAAAPDMVSVLHHTAGHLGHWHERGYPLYDPIGQPLWLIHPLGGRATDVVALPLPDASNTGVDYYPYDLQAAQGIFPLKPTADVSVIGFPFGMASDRGIGIWARGTIASEPSLDYQGKPVFLIDSRTRQGQSGSPVIAFSSGGMVEDQHGNSVFYGEPVWELLGVYSGRISKESDIGLVWKRQTIVDVIEGAQRDTAQFE